MPIKVPDNLQNVFRANICAPSILQQAPRRIQEGTQMARDVLRKRLGQLVNLSPDRVTDNPEGFAVHRRELLKSLAVKVVVIRLPWP